MSRPAGSKDLQLGASRLHTRGHEPRCDGQGRSAWSLQAEDHQQEKKTKDNKKVRNGAAHHKSTVSDVTQEGSKGCHGWHLDMARHRQSCDCCRREFGLNTALPRNTMLGQAIPSFLLNASFPYKPSPDQWDPSTKFLDLRHWSAIRAKPMFLQQR